MSTQDTQPATQPQPQPQEQKTSKRKPSDAQSQPPPIHFTARDPPWTYLKLQLISQPQTKNDTLLDPLTARTYLTAALGQFLGLIGTSISIDILKIASSSTSTASSTSTSTPKNIVWVRVPRPDAAAVVAALSSWIGGTSGNGVAWRVCAKGNFLGALVAGDGRDLFVP
ncbi:uncharacterized protein ASPGLDRAFT_43635 [Aspergillus glaucus CBS 516.65]|uniref:Ribonucleases P/MRP subunit Pop8-like domain-containing protein n=1 Tax=Aspergillus glaucus CBS 516.65 TaxID=1160497 RepID=A0A1L9VT96_ASPGL|nr:hypothetical protein ASPGLDRAFT_43635 [Aspergillus glaucus CBS 516.65]OJJ87143.1 hypothetical protein ASPGLDRAFT_43635 [Aspergillus glaucus CBS 516.65]